MGLRDPVDRGTDVLGGQVLEVQHLGVVDRERLARGRPQQAAQLLLALAQALRDLLRGGSGVGEGGHGGSRLLARRLPFWAFAAPAA